MNNEKPREIKIWDVVTKKCEHIGFGEWEIKLIIHNGECVGFDQLKDPVIKFRKKHYEKI